MEIFVIIADTLLYRTWKAVDLSRQNGSNSVASTVAKTIGQKISTVSFKDFMKQKETDRQSKFEPKKKKN